MRPDDDFAMSWEVDGKADKHIKEIAQARSRAPSISISPPTPTARARRSPGMCEEVLQAAPGAQGRRRQARRVQRGHHAARCSTPSAIRARSTRAGRRLSGAPRARLPGRLHAVAGAVAQAAGQPLGRPRAVGGAAPRLRARGRDRGLQARANTGRSRSISQTAGGRALHGAPDRISTASGSTASTSTARRRPATPPTRSQPRTGFTVAAVEQQAGPPQSAAAVHHLDLAAGSLAQARLRREPHHARRAAAL